MRRTFPPVQSPFRDELETLRRENERLRAELSAYRRPQPMVGFAIAGVDIVAALLLRPWLNGSSDVLFWGALVILAAITFTAGLATVGYKRHPR